MNSRVLAMNMPQRNINYNENKNGADASASQFFCAVSSDEASEEFVHYCVILFKIKM